MLVSCVCHQSFPENLYNILTHNDGTAKLNDFSTKLNIYAVPAGLNIQMKILRFARKYIIIIHRIKTETNSTCFFSFKIYS